MVLGSLPKRCTARGKVLSGVGITPQVLRQRGEYKVGAREEFSGRSEGRSKDAKRNLKVRLDRSSAGESSRSAGGGEGPHAARCIAPARSYRV